MGKEKVSNDVSDGDDDGGNVVDDDDEETTPTTRNSGWMESTNLSTSHGC